MLDLDAIVEKKRYIKFMGRDVEIKNLTTFEYLKSQSVAADIEDVPEGVDIAEFMAGKLTEYVMLVLDVTEEEAKQMEFRQFRALKEYFTKIDLMDQGFSEKEIAMMEKRAAKNQMEQAMNASLQ